jgi:hypothetical protein
MLRLEEIQKCFGMQNPEIDVDGAPGIDRLEKVH